MHFYFEFFLLVLSCGRPDFEFLHYYFKHGGILSPRLVSGLFNNGKSIHWYIDGFLVLLKGLVHGKHLS